MPHLAFATIIMIVLILVVALNWVWDHTIGLWAWLTGG
jgi:hypothetical protein